MPQNFSIGFSCCKDVIMGLPGPPRLRLLCIVLFSLAPLTESQTESWQGLSPLQASAGLRSVILNIAGFGFTNVSQYRCSLVAINSQSQALVANASFLSNTKLQCAVVWLFPAAVVNVTVRRGTDVIGGQLRSKLFNFQGTCPYPLP